MRARRANMLVLTLIAAMTALVLAGCGGVVSSDGGGDNGSTTSGSGPASPSTSPKKHNVIAWIIGLGPGAPGGPPEFSVYYQLQHRHCSEVFTRVGELDSVPQTIYGGAANACLAAFDNRTDLWSRATKALEEVDGHTQELTCIDRAALALLQRLVTLHRDHPDQSFEQAPTKSSKAPPCPNITSVTPDHGSAGDLITLHGRHLADTTGVAVVDSGGLRTSVDVAGQHDSSISFTMPDQPAQTDSATVCIVVASSDWDSDGVLFTYDADPPAPQSKVPCPPMGQ
jgi:hypothetical protein